MNDLDVSPVTDDDASAFVSLYRFYWYDFTEFTGEDLDSYEERFVEPYLDKTHYTPFLFRVDGKLAGLAVVRTCDAVDGSGEATDMEQFFVMRKYRRRGVGEAAATTLFGRYPGRWQVRERHNNLPAQAFWRAIIGRYTGAEFTELAVTESPTGGPVQFFESAVAVRHAGPKT